MIHRNNFVILNINLILKLHYFCWKPNKVRNIYAGFAKMFPFLAHFFFLDSIETDIQMYIY